MTMSTDVPKMPCDVDQKFHMKIKYNFKVHVLLCLKGVNWNRQDILNKIYTLNGYRCHKVVKYGTEWSHLHVKFTEEQQATMAVEFFKNTNTDLTAILVEDLLRDWYDFETRSNFNPPWTLAIVDVVGITPKLMNFLTENLLNCILEDFGSPYLLPYTAALNETHVQVLFSSMTEALAACMAFGQWYKTSQKTDQFYYRVRISPCDKESLLIRNSGGIPEEAFKLDYFLNARHEINLRSSIATTKQTVSRKNYRTGASQNRGFERDCKQHNAEASHSHKSSCCMKLRTPVICIPVIAPLNGSYTQSLTIEEDSADDECAVMRVQGAKLETGEQTLIEPDQELRFCSSSSLQESSRNLSGSEYQTIRQHIHQSKRDAVTDFTRIPDPPQTGAPYIPRQSRTRQRNVYKGNSLVFERRT